MQLHFALAYIRARKSKARKILGWTPIAAFEDGIRRTIKWYIDSGKAWGYEKHGWLWRYLGPDLMICSLADWKY